MNQSLCACVLSTMGRKRTSASPRQRPQEIAFQNRISSVSVGQARVSRGLFHTVDPDWTAPSERPRLAILSCAGPHTGHAWSSRNSLPLDRPPRQIGKMVAYSPPCPSSLLRLCAPPSGGSGPRAFRSIAYVCDRSDRSSPVQGMPRGHGVCVAARVSPKSARRKPTMLVRPAAETLHTGSTKFYGHYGISEPRRFRGNAQ